MGLKSVEVLLISGQEFFLLFLYADVVTDVEINLWMILEAGKIVVGSRLSKYLWWN